MLSACSRKSSERRCSVCYRVLQYWKPWFLFQNPINSFCTNSVPKVIWIRLHRPQREPWEWQDPNMVGNDPAKGTSANLGAVLHHRHHWQSWAFTRQVQRLQRQQCSPEIHQFPLPSEPSWCALLPSRASLHPNTTFQWQSDLCGRSEHCQSRFTEAK